MGKSWRRPELAENTQAKGKGLWVFILGPNPLLQLDL
jgi:hypothetical protein